MEDNLKIYNMIKKVPDEAQKKIDGLTWLFDDNYRVFKSF